MIEGARILFYSDKPILALGLRQALSGIEDLRVAEHSGGIGSLVHSLESFNPDLLLLDLTSDVTLDFLTTIHRADHSAKVVLWVHYISTEMALQALGVGVRGILNKTLSPETLVTALRKIRDGELWFEKALTDSILTARRYTLTRREGQIVTLVAQGLKNKELGMVLSISEGTVKVYLSRLFKKLGLKDRFELALFGLKNITPGFAPETEKGSNRPKPILAGGQDLRSLFVERLPIRSDLGQFLGRDSS